MTPDMAVHLVDPRNTWCFLPRDGVTECNAFAKCVCACMGVYLPPAKANEQHDYLANVSNGWRKLDAGDAALHAARNELVLAVWKNPTGAHGHIAVLHSRSTPGAIYVSAAGASNVECAPLEQQFGLSLHPDFFIPEVSHG